MFCRKFDPIEIKCPESGYFRKKLWKNRLMWALVALFIGVGLGQWWRAAQVDPQHRAEVKALKEKIDHYREAWTPIREREVVRGSGRR